jgi:hypothetical protein
MAQKAKQDQTPNGHNDDVREALESGEPSVTEHQQGRPIDSMGEPEGRKDRSPELDLESGRHGTK